MEDTKKNDRKEEQPDRLPADSAIAEDGETAVKEKKDGADQEIDIKQLPVDGICGGY